MQIFSSKVTGKKQSDGAFSVLLGSKDRACRHQIQVEVSATPAAGSLAVAVRSPNATDFVTVDGAIDMTGTDLLKILSDYAFAAELKFTPSGFDADKTYNVIVTSGD